jgi:hypothetical protein
MRTLSRPMFNMGGPIKEGVMHGIREPYRHGRRVGYAEGTPGWGGYFRNIFQKSKPLAKQVFGKKFKPVVGAMDQIAKQKWLATLPQSVRQAVQTTKGIPGSVTGQTFMQNLKSFPGVSKIPGWATKVKDLALKYPKTTALSALYGGPTVIAGAKQIPWSGIGGFLDPRPGWREAFGIEEEVEDKGDKDKIKSIQENIEMPARDTGSDYGQFDRAQKRIAEGKATELAKQQKDDRVNKLLEMMGYDKAKKGAAYDALIDASQIIAAAPGGKGLDISKDIIQPAIAATSKRFDKPKEIEEAVRLMMVKGEIEKDIASGKGGPLKQNAKDLVAAGVFKNETEAMKHLASKKTMGNVVAEVSKQFGISGANADVLDTSLRIKEDVIPQGKWKGDNKVYKEFKNNNKDKADIELEFVGTIDDRKAGDYYIVDKRIVLVDENLNPDYYY